MTQQSVHGFNQANINYRILAIGTPIVDYLIPISDDYLHSVPGARGGSTLVNHSALQKILNDQPLPLKFIAGGSAANTIKGLSMLNHACSFFGKIGNDDTGKKFLQDIETFGVRPYLPISTLPTGLSACLITPDHDRTIRTFIGAGAEMNENDLNPKFFEKVHLVHIEGYLINRQKVVEKAMRLAKEAGATISFDISSFEIASDYRKQLIELLKNYVNIVFANEEEAYALTRLPPEKACLFLKNITGLAVVKMGSQGSWAAKGSTQAFHHAFKVPVVDTTGAGDLFASGFLHGFLNNQSLQNCLHIGTKIASKVIQTFGAEIPKDAWSDIKTQVAP